MHQGNLVKVIYPANFQLDWILLLFLNNKKQKSSRPEKPFSNNFFEKIQSYNLVSLLFSFGSQFGSANSWHCVRSGSGRDRKKGMSATGDHTPVYRLDRDEIFDNLILHHRRKNHIRFRCWVDSRAFTGQLLTTQTKAVDLVTVLQRTRQY